VINVQNYITRERDQKWKSKGIRNGARTDQYDIVQSTSPQQSSLIVIKIEYRHWHWNKKNGKELVSTPSKTQTNKQTDVSLSVCLCLRWSLTPHTHRQLRSSERNLYNAYNRAPPQPEQTNLSVTSMMHVARSAQRSRISSHLVVEKHSIHILCDSIKTQQLCSNPRRRSDQQREAVRRCSGTGAWQAAALDILH